VREKETKDKVGEKKQNVRESTGKSHAPENPYYCTLSYVLMN